MKRLVLTTLLALASTVVIGVSAIGCGDDTSGNVDSGSNQDLSANVDMGKGDLSTHDASHD